MICILSLLAGCQTGQNQAVHEQEKERIVLWSYFETDAQIEALDELVDNFNISQNTYEASWEYVPMTEFSRKLTMAYTEKSLPDLALIDNPDMPVGIRMGMFEDITDFLTELKVNETYYPALMQTVTYKSRMYGIPFDCNNVALIYNKKLLKEHDIEPPGTWEELEEAAAQLTTEERSGFLMSAVEGEQGAFQMLPWILSAGEQPYSIGEEKTAEAFSFIDGLIDKGYMTGSCINYSQTDVARIFVQGGAAMMENGPWVFPMLKQAGIDYGVSRLPVSEKSSVIVGGENLGILKGKNIEGAKAFIRYCDQDDVMARFCKKTGVIPTKHGIDITGQPDMQVFQEQMDGAVVRSSIPSWNRMSGRLSNALYRMVAGEVSPEEAAQYLKIKEE